MGEAAGRRCFVPSFLRFFLGRAFIEPTFRHLPLFSGYCSESPEPGLFIRNPAPRRFPDGWPPLELPGPKNIANLSDALCLPSFSRWHQGKPPAAAGSPSCLRGGNESNGPLKDTSKYIRKMHPWAISYNRAEVGLGPPSPPPTSPPERITTIHGNHRTLAGG